MKTLVVYSTKTGNTKKVAEAIAQALPGAELHDVKTAPAPDAYDFIAMGFWVDKGGPNKEAADYMKTISGKKVFTFFTLGAKSSGCARCPPAIPTRPPPRPRPVGPKPPSTPTKPISSTPPRPPPRLSPRPRPERHPTCGSPAPAKPEHKHHTRNPSL